MKQKMTSRPEDQTKERKEAKKYGKVYPEVWYMCESEPVNYVQEMKLGGLFFVARKEMKKERGMRR